MSAAGPTVPCPSCREFIHPAAELCPLCGADVRDGGVPDAVVAEMRARVAELTAQAGAPADVTAAPSTLRTVTVVFWILTVATFVPAFLIKEGWIFLFLGLFIFFLPALFLGIADLAFPSPKKRKTPEAAARCYYKGIQQRRWKVCWAALSPAGRGRHVTVPSIPDMKTVADDVDLTEPKAIKQYWKRIVLSSPTPFGMGRRILRVNVVPQGQIAPHLARVRIDLVVEYYPQWVFLFVLVGALVAVLLYAVLRRQRNLTFDVLLVEHKSQWWVLTGEAWPPIDQAVMKAIAAEATSSSSSAYPTPRAAHEP